MLQQVAIGYYSVLCSINAFGSKERKRNRTISHESTDLLMGKSINKENNMSEALETFLLFPKRDQRKEKSKR